VFLIYGSKITAASRGFPVPARLSCLLRAAILQLFTRAYITVTFYTYTCKSFFRWNIIDSDTEFYSTLAAE